MTHLRQWMLDELERRNYSPNTVRSYLHAVEEFARHFGRSPEQLGPDHVREYQVHLFRDRKLSARTIAGQTAALRFLFVKTLRLPYPPDALPFPKHSRRLPTVLSQEEVARLIDASGNLMHRAMLMTLYATRCAPGRAVPAQGRRHRQRTHGAAHPRRQGWTRPRYSVEPEAARDTARVLALDQAEEPAHP